MRAILTDNSFDRTIVMRAAHTFRLLTLAGACAAAAAPLAAQESQLKAYAEFALASATPGGGLSHISGGMGVNFAGVITTDQPLFFAIGVQFTKHTTNDQPDKLGLLETYVEPRFQLVRHGKLIPFVGIRLAYVRATQTQTLIDDAGATVTASGVQTGPSVGVAGMLMYRSSQHVRVFANVAVQEIKLGDLDFDYARVSGSSATGRAIVGHLGVSLDFSLEPEKFRAFLRR